MKSVPLVKITEDIASELQLFIEIFVLLYAEDTLLFAETPEGL